MTPLNTLVSVEQTLFDAQEPYFIEALQIESAERAANTTLSLGSLAMQFAHVERIPRYNESSRENDAEHSFMLSLVACELAASYFPALDTGLVAQFSTVHDLIELETGDIPTYTLNDGEIAAKETAEHAALQALSRKLPNYTLQLLMRYEAQIENEARFVRLVDKLLPVVVDILGPGKQVMREDYAIETSRQLADNETRLSNKLRERFPDTELAFLHVVRDLLATRFDIIFNWEEAPSSY